MEGGISSHPGELFFRPLMTFFYFVLCNMRDTNIILREGYIIYGLPTIGKSLASSGPILLKNMLNSLLIVCESFVKTPLILY